MLYIIFVYFNWYLQLRPNFLWQDCTVHALCIFCLTTCFLAASCGDILKNDNNKNQTFEGRLPANPGGSNKCVWIIVVQRGIIELAFKDRFQVTSLAQDCKENYVQVQDGRYRYNTMKCSAIRAELYTKDRVVFDWGSKVICMSDWTVVILPSWWLDDTTLASFSTFFCQIKIKSLAFSSHLTHSHDCLHVHLITVTLCLLKVTIILFLFTLSSLVQKLRSKKERKDHLLEEALDC